MKLIINVLIIIFFIVAIVISINISNRNDNKATQEFVNLEFEGTIDSIFWISRGLSLSFINSKKNISLGVEGTYLRDRLFSGDSLVKISGVNGFYIFYKVEDIYIEPLFINCED